MNNIIVVVVIFVAGTKLLLTTLQEKITLGISLLLSLVVFLTLIVKKFLPPSSLAFPWIAKYLVFTFIINFASIAMTVYISNVNHRETFYMSKTLKWIFLVNLPWMLFMDRPRKYRYYSTEEQHKRQDTKEVNNYEYNFCISILFPFF